MTQRICKIEFCDRAVRAKDMCAGHYSQTRRGVPLTPLPVAGQGTRRLAAPGEPVCAVDHCRRRAKTRGLCPTHYRAQLHGLPFAKLDLTDEERFFEKVVLDGECWRWTGQVQGGGYGHGAFRFAGYEGAAYRWAYEFLRHPIPAGLHLDHLCRNPACVNPWHLEPVTSRVNTLRGDAPHAINKRKTHCKHGHEFTPENTLRSPQGHRVCKACCARIQRQKRARRKARELGTTITPREKQ